MEFFKLINSWWPWFNIYNDIFFIQFFICITFIYIYLYNNIYYTFLYVFINFFLLGLYLSIFQVELFTAFLWLVECSVLFVFLLLLFYLNIKGLYSFTFNKYYIYLVLIIFFFLSFCLNSWSEFDITSNIDLSFIYILDNFYESISNPIMNDLFGFYISYYTLNNVEFIFIGFLLLLGSVICVNLYQINKNSRVNNVTNSLSLFNFFQDFSSFFFLRKQNLIKQGNTKSSLKVFKKK